MTCQPCTAGNYCPVGAAAEAACPDGFFSGANSAVCTPCAAGKYCSKIAETDCPGGTYSLGLVTSCTYCPAGMDTILFLAYSF